MISFYSLTRFCCLNLTKLQLVCNNNCRTMTSGPLHPSLVLSNRHRTNVKYFCVVVGAVTNVSTWVIWAIYINLGAIYNQPIQSWCDDVFIKVQIDAYYPIFTRVFKKYKYKYICIFLLSDSINHVTNLQTSGQGPAPSLGTTGLYLQ